MIELKSGVSDAVLGTLVVPDWVITDILPPEFEELSVKENLENAKSTEALAAEIGLPAQLLGERLDLLWRRWAVLRLKIKGGEVWMRKRGYQTWRSKLRSFRVEPPAVTE